MLKGMTVVAVVFMFWTLHASAFQCETISGSISNKIRKPIQMTADQAASSAEGVAISEGGVKIKVLVKTVRKAGLLTEGTSPVNGASLTLGIINPESKLGSDTIASVSAEGIKNALNSADLKLSALGRVGENSWIRVECRGE